MSGRPVTILGAGTAGLTLSRCLRRRGIPTETFEKSPPPFRQHVYGITLEPRAYKPLLALLGKSEGRFRQQVAVDRHCTHHHGCGLIQASDAKTDTAFRASLSAFRWQLMRVAGILGLHGEKDVSHGTLRESSEGKTFQVVFQDGSTLESPFIVDTLGFHSKLRRWIFPKVSLNVEPYAVYTGVRTISSQLFKDVYLPQLNGATVLVHPPHDVLEPRFEVCVDDIHYKNGDVRIRWKYSSWAGAGAPEFKYLFNPDRDIRDSTFMPKPFFREIWRFGRRPEILSNPIFKDILQIEKIREDRKFNWLMRTVMMPKADLLHLLENYGVAMIGDSVHAVPVLGGHGANMAITDAVELAEVIAQHWQNNSLKEGVAKFYQTKWDQWNTAVEDSKKELALMHRNPVKAQETHAKL